jgi:hypothetical protein
MQEAPSSRFWDLGNHQLFPQRFAEDYPHPAHNQSNQKAMPLPILDNGPMTAINTSFSRRRIRNPLKNELATPQAEKCNKFFPKNAPQA